MEFPNKISLAAVKSRFFTRLFVTVLSHTATKKKREKRKKKKVKLKKDEAMQYHGSRIVQLMEVPII